MPNILFFEILLLRTGNDLLCWCSTHTHTSHLKLSFKQYSITGHFFKLFISQKKCWVFKCDTRKNTFETSSIRQFIWNLLNSRGFSMFVAWILSKKGNFKEIFLLHVKVRLHQLQPENLQEILQIVKILNDRWGLRLFS